MPPVCLLGESWVFPGGLLGASWVPPGCLLDTGQIRSRSGYRCKSDPDPDTGQSPDLDADTDPEPDAGADSDPDPDPEQIQIQTRIQIQIQIQMHIHLDPDPDPDVVNVYTQTCGSKNVLHLSVPRQCRWLLRPAPHLSVVLFSPLSKKLSAPHLPVVLVSLPFTAFCSQWSLLCALRHKGQVTGISTRRITAHTSTSCCAIGKPRGPWHVCI